jgi:hypothetical protein
MSSFTRFLSTKQLAKLSLKPRCFSTFGLLRQQAALDSKITTIVDQISTLTLMETASLVEELKVSAFILYFIL